MRKKLVEFGYEGLWTETVIAIYDKAINGETPVGAIDMMVKSQLEKSGLI